MNALQDDVDKVRIEDGIQHEMRLRRWVLRFYEEIIAPLQLSQDGSGPYCKFFELRPFSYALL